MFVEIGRNIRTIDALGEGFKTFSSVGFAQKFKERTHGGFLIADQIRIAQTIDRLSAIRLLRFVAGIRSPEPVFVGCLFGID